MTGGAGARGRAAGGGGAARSPLDAVLAQEPAGVEEEGGGLPEEAHAAVVVEALAEDADGQCCEGGEGVEEEEGAVGAEHDGGEDEVAGVVGDGDGEVEAGDLGGMPQRVGRECLRDGCCIKAGWTMAERITSGSVRTLPWSANFPHLVQIQCSCGAETAN